MASHCLTGRSASATSRAGAQRAGDPGASSTPHPYVTEQRIDLTIRGAPPAEERSLNPVLPTPLMPTCMSNGAVHDAVLSLLNE